MDSEPDTPFGGFDTPKDYTKSRKLHKWRKRTKRLADKVSTAAGILNGALKIDEMTDAEIERSDIRRAKRLLEEAIDEIPTDFH